MRRCSAEDAAPPVLFTQLLQTMTRDTADFIADIALKRRLNARWIRNSLRQVLCLQLERTCREAEIPFSCGMFEHQVLIHPFRHGR